MIYQIMIGALGQEQENLGSTKLSDKRSRAFAFHANRVASRMLIALERDPFAPPHFSDLYEIS